MIMKAATNIPAIVLKKFYKLLITHLGEINNFLLTSITNPPIDVEENEFQRSAQGC